MARRTTHINVKSVAYPFGQEYYPDNTQPTVETGSGSAEGEISALAMANVLPTEYGYTSFFGATDLGLSVPLTTEYAFTYRTPVGNNVLVALGLFGAQFSKDGVTWDISEVTAPDYYVAATAEVPAWTANSPDLVDNNQAVSGAVTQVSAKFLHVSIGTGTFVSSGKTDSVVPSPAEFDAGFTLRIYPLGADNTFGAPTELTETVFAHQSKGVTLETNFITPIVGDTYSLSIQGISATYRALQGDTNTAILDTLIADFNGQQIAVTASRVGTTVTFSSVQVIASADFINVSQSNLDDGLNYPTPVFTITDAQVDTSFDVSGVFGGNDWVIVHALTPVNDSVGSRFAQLLVDGVAVPLIRFGTDLTNVNYSFDGARFWSMSHSYSFMVRAGSTLEVRHVDPLGAGTLGTFTLEFYHPTIALTDLPYTWATFNNGAAAYTWPSYAITYTEPEITGVQCFIKSTAGTTWYDVGDGSTLNTTTVAGNQANAAWATSVIPSLISTGVPLANKYILLNVIGYGADVTDTTVTIGDFPTNVLLRATGVTSDGVLVQQVDVPWSRNSAQLTITTPAMLTAITAKETVQPWSFAIVQNKLYCYRQGLGKVLTYDTTLEAWASFVPSFLNLSAIIGIFAARSRLGAWDSDGSIYISSTNSVADFTPSIATQANVLKADALIGRIINILPIVNGFVIYATGSIVLAQYQLANKTSVFSFTGLSSSAGISQRHAVVEGSDGVHFAYTGEGLMAVSQQGLTRMSAEASSYIQSSSAGVRLDWVQERYLAISISPMVDSAALLYNETEYTNLANEFQLALRNSTVIAQALSDLGINPDIGGDPEELIDFSIDYLDYPNFIINSPLPWNEARPVIRTRPPIKIARKYLIEAMFVSLYNVDIRMYHYIFSYNYYETDLRVYLFPYYVRTGEFPGGDIVITKTSQSVYHPEVDWFTHDAGPDANPRYTSYSVGGFIWQSLVYNSHPYAYLTTDYGIISYNPQTGMVQSRYDYDFNVSTDYSYSESLYPTDLQPYTPPIDGGITIKRTVTDTINLPLTQLVNAQGIGIGLTTDTITINLSTLPVLTLEPRLVSVLSKLIPESTVNIPTAGIGTFLVSSGSTEYVTPVYTRALILDTVVKNWGSLDRPFREVINMSPVNMRTYNPVTNTTSTKFTYQNLAKTLVVHELNNKLTLATENNDSTSYITYGKVGYTASGVTRMLDVTANFATSTNATLDVKIPDGTVVATTTGLTKLHKVYTAKWFTITVSGRFALKGLAFSGEIGGKR